MDRTAVYGCICCVWSETMFLVNPTKASGRFAPSAIVGLMRNSLSEALSKWV